MKALFRHGMWTTAMSIIQALMGFSVSILLARLLGPTERGAYTVAFLVIGTAGFIANPCIYSAANYFLSSGKWTLEQLLLPTLVLSLVSGLIAGIFALYGGSKLADSLAVLGYPTWLLTGLGAAAYAFGLSLNGLLYGLRRVQAISIWTTTLGISQLVVSGLLVLAFAPSVQLFVSVYVGMLAVDVIVKLWLGTHKLNGRLVLRRTMLWAMVRYGGSVYLGRVLMLLAQRTDTYVLYLFAGQTALGYYTIATSLGEQLWLFPLAINLVMMANIAQRNDDDAAQVTERASRAVFTLTLLAALALSFLGAWAIPALYGDVYMPAVGVLLFILPGVVSISCYLLMEPFFQSRGKPLLPVLITGGGMLANVLLSIALVGPLGMHGAALAYSISYFFQLALACWFFARTTGHSVWAPIDIRRAVGEALAMARSPEARGSMPFFRRST